MGHYDDQYEEHERLRLQERAHRIATRYAEIKEPMREVSKFVSDRGDSRLSDAWERFRAELSHYRYINGVLIEDPNILVRKLSKE